MLKRIILTLISLIAPAAVRGRWLEEWTAEVRHGGWRLLAGAPRDAWTVRTLARAGRASLAASRAGVLHAIDQDLRYAFRGLLAAPGFVAGVVLSLGIGMAVTTAAFSFVNALALRPPAGITDPDDLVQIRLTRAVPRPVQPATEASVLLTYSRNDYQAFVHLGGAVRSLIGLAAHRAAELAVAFPGEPVATRGMIVSGRYFELLGVRPAAGRLIGAGDDVNAGAHPVVVLSYRAWVRHFAADHAVVGSTLRVNGAPLEVIGVAPRGFSGVRMEIDEDESPDAWIPFSMSHLTIRDRAGDPVSIAQAPLSTVGLVGRLARGVTMAAAQAEIQVLVAGLDDERPDAPTRAQVLDLRPRGIVSDIAAFMAIPLIVLALACVNAANLLSSRATRRLRDAAVRLSIGATPWRIVRQMLVESLLLAVGGAALGLAFTWWIVAAFEYFLPVELHVDWRVVSFSLLTAVATAFAFGLAPGVSAAARADDLVRGMAKRRRTRARALLIGAQAALSLALLSTGWQFANTVRVLAQSDGLRAADRLVLASVDVGQLRWPRADVDAYYARVLDRVRQLPGVVHVALTCACEPWGAWNSRGGGAVKVWLPQHPPDKPGSALAMLSEGDLAGAMELPIVAGRGFRPDDHKGPVRTVLANQALADKHLGASPVGYSMRVAAFGGGYSTSQPVVVGGVVQTPSARRTDSLPMIYYPSPLELMPARTVYVRFDRDGEKLIPLLHAAIREVNADVPRPTILTAEAKRWERQESNQYLAAAVSLLGIVALLLSAGGLYGVVVFVVTMRSHEIAVRMALGAETRAVVRMIVRQALKPAAIGVAVGAFGAAVIGMVVRSRLYGASPVDPVAFGGAAALLLGVLLIASGLPARRAARIDPIQVLRTE